MSRALAVLGGKHVGAACCKWCTLTHGRIQMGNCESAVGNVIKDSRLATSLLKILHKKFINEGGETGSYLNPTLFHTCTKAPTGEVEIKCTFVTKGKHNKLPALFQSEAFTCSYIIRDYHFQSIYHSSGVIQGARPIQLCRHPCQNR